MEKPSDKKNGSTSPRPDTAIKDRQPPSNDPAAAGDAKALPGHFSIPLYLCFCILTCGLYPYIYLRRNAQALANFSDRVSARRIKVYTAIGLAVQAVAIVGLLLFLYGLAFSDGAPAKTTSSPAVAYLFLLILIVLPLRCFHQFNIAAAIRHEVILWDPSQIMIGRTANSWTFLFLLGSVYIQHHINRLAGLGMPTLRDDDSAAEPAEAEVLGRGVAVVHGKGKGQSNG